MGKVLEMMPRQCFAALAALSFLLSGCGSDKDATAGVRLVKDIATTAVQRRKAPAAPVAPTTQARLAQFKTPMVMAELPAIGVFTFVVPYGQNGDVETWASSDDKTIAFRQGVMIATRGFGPDLMQSAGPSIGQIAAASGSYDRIYYYLDGADQTLRRDFRCTLSNLGTETITVVERQHTTRHVAEECTGKSGRFTNEYWFENGTFLRKSKQLLNLEWGPLVLSRVIDKG
jgi:Group 4 capsule polysaccharide lipoprotein gfcB, YjbF